jgi:hypothetical protein
MVAAEACSVKFDAAYSFRAALSFAAKMVKGVNLRQAPVNTWYSSHIKISGLLCALLPIVLGARCASYDTALLSPIPAQRSVVVDLNRDSKDDVVSCDVDGNLWCVLSTAACFRVPGL